VSASDLKANPDVLSLAFALPLATMIGRFNRGLLPVFFTAFASENHQPENERDGYD